ncbi:tetratricopeptide repeat protein [Bradyrhizobium sp. CCGUVB14]|uniref:tetratricopeptide repeat-containing glycosyltransferase family protein n=1 Tax=Bradyrhizobium sp. CCGUVB14 TaxID=2949628 RepID=UPI0020B27F16|nr:tetratricopeptide repeat-containing glycosyltransferase family protein [Bradyrhizobium sp. CCGUVB14]MCP3440327.1 tetratricopeptide repeat-containing glycosyltransferase family protein [Bradyrhizobium sp. CCGUVB14]
MSPGNRGQKRNKAQPAKNLREANLRESVSAYLKEGRHLDAQRLCEQALSASGVDKAEILHLMGEVFFSAGHFGQAVEWFSQAVRSEPRPRYLANLATALAKQGRIEQALQVADKAVQLAPSDASLWSLMGNLLIDATRSSDALLCFKHAFELDGHLWEAAYKAGHLLHGLEQFDDALTFLDRSIQAKPDHAPSFHMRALVLKSLKRLDEARADNMRAIELDPTNADTHGNLGNVLQALGRHDQAVLSFDRALAMAPHIARTITNRAASLVELRRLDQAKTEYERSLAIAPELAVTEWNLALLQLLTGEFEKGWRGREARWEIPHLSRGYPQLGSQRWLGDESIAGKTVLVCADEGLGDTIQFVRYIPFLAAQGARVVLLVEESLASLFSGMDGLVQCVLKRDDSVLPAFDFHCALDSLPLIFGTTLNTIPSARSYLPAVSPDRIAHWETRLGRRDRRRIGLVWSGNPRHWNDRNRSVPLSVFSRLMDVDAQFVSLQKDPRPLDKQVLDQRPDVVDLTGDLADFSDTAALISALDLVIAVDTSVAHLAAALGCPTWILLPYVPDYRWLLGRDDSPWYPTVRLFRQTEGRDYDSVIDRVREALTLLDG